MNEKNLKKIFNAINTISPQAVLIFDDTGDIIYANEHASLMLGKTIAELVGMNYLNCVNPDQYEIIRKIMAILEHDTEKTHHKFQLSKGDGFSSDSNLLASTVRDNVGCIEAYIFSIEDITEKTETKNRLIQSEQRFRRIFECGAIGIVLTDPGFRFIEVNPRVCELLGYERNELESMTFLDITHPDDIKKSKTLMKKFYRESGAAPLRIEKRFLKKNKNILWGAVTISMMESDEGVPLYTIGMIEDITEQKNAEESLRNNKKDMKALLDATTDSAYLWDTEGRILTMNETARKRLSKFNDKIRNKTVTELRGTKIFQYFAPDKRAFIKEIKEKALRTSSQVRIRFSMFGRVLDINILPVSDDDGGIRKIAVFSKDITKHKDAEKKIRESEKKFSNLVESMFEGVAIINSKDRVVYFNERIAEVSGFACDELIGRHALDFFDKSHIETLKQMLRRVREHKNFKFEAEALIKDGSWLCLNLSVSPLIDEDGNYQGAQAIISDITAIKNAMRQLNYKAGIESLIARISTSFINLHSDEIDQALENALEQIGHFSKEEKVFLFQSHEDRTKAYYTHEWCAEGIKKSFKKDMKISLSNFSAFKEIIPSSDLIHVPDVTFFPSDDVSDFFVSNRIRAFLVFRLFIKGSFAGFLGFSSSEKKTWSENAISLLKMASVVFTNALDKKQINEKLVDEIMKRLSSREIELLQHLVSGCTWPEDKRLIGKKMDVLPGTLDKFMTRIKSKIMTDDINMITIFLRRQKDFPFYCKKSTKG